MSIPALYETYMTFDPGWVEMLAWLLQAILALLIVYVAPASRTLRWSEPSTGACAAVIGFAWAWRMTHLFVLASGDFKFWMDDDTRRFINAFAWSLDPYLLVPLPPNSVLGPALEMPATHIVHGLMMAGLPDPLIASKLVSALSNLLALVAIFLFTRAVFANAFLACAAVLFLGGHWLHVLWGSGTLTELPMTAFLLAGSAFTLSALAGSPGTRTRAAWAASIMFILATTVHLTAWIYLGGILVVVLSFLVLQRRFLDRAVTAPALIIAGISPLFCLAWMIYAWLATDRPFFFMSELAALETYKIGGGVSYRAAFLTLFVPVSSAYRSIYLVFVFSLALVILSVIFARPRYERLKPIARRLPPPILKLARGLGAAGMIGSLVATVICRPYWGRIFVWPLVGTVITDLEIYPRSIVFFLRFLLPLLVFGLIFPWLRKDEAYARPRGVLLSIAAVLGVFVWTALRGGTNLTPFRTISPLATALVPFALAPALLGLSPPAGAAGPPRSSGFRLKANALLLGLLGLLSCLFLVDNFQKVEQRRSIYLYAVNTLGPKARHFTNRYDPDLYALGAWIRREAIDPHYLGSANWKHPFRVWIPEGGFYDARGDTWRIIVHAIGNPRWLERREFGYRHVRLHHVLRGLKPGQIVISLEPLDEPYLRAIIRLGSVLVYEAEAATR